MDDDRRSRGGTHIGPSGGVVEGPNGARIEIPEGALSEEVEIGIRLASSADLEGINWSALETTVDDRFVTAEVTSFSFFQPGASAPEEDDGVEEAGDAYEVTPHGQQFNLPVRVRIPYRSRVAGLGLLRDVQNQSTECWEYLPEDSNFYGVEGTPYPCDCVQHAEGTRSHFWGNSKYAAGQPSLCCDGNEAALEIHWRAPGKGGEYEMAWVAECGYNCTTLPQFGFTVMGDNWETWYACYNNADDDIYIRERWPIENRNRTRFEYKDQMFTIHHNGEELFVGKCTFPELYALSFNWLAFPNDTEITVTCSAD